MDGDDECKDKVRKSLVHGQSVGVNWICPSNEVKIKRTDFLQSTARSATAHLAGAVTIAADIDLGQFSDSHNRDSGLKGNAERSIIKTCYKVVITYSDDMLISGASKQISLFPPILVSF